MVDVSLVFASIGFVIVLGFVANYFFKKTRIPDVIWLLALGLLVGPLTKTLESSFLLPYAPYFAALATMIILFQGGIHTDLYTLIKQVPISMFLAIGNVIGSMVLVSFFMNTFFGWSWIYGALLGAIIGGTSSPIIISITSDLPLDQKTVAILNLESTITDVLCFVVSMAIISIILSGEASLSVALNKIFGSFSIGAVIGFVMGIVWLFIMSKIYGKFEYMLTLAYLFLVYAFVENIMGSGAIAALVLGIVLGNAKDMSRILKTKQPFRIDGKIREFHEEISFLVKSFFFVYLGILVNITSVSFIIIGVLITLLLFGIRMFITTISFLAVKLDKYDKRICMILMSRGLAAAVLSQFPVTYGLNYGYWFVNLIFVVIVASILFSTLGIALLKKDRKTLTRK